MHYCKNQTYDHSDNRHRQLWNLSGHNLYAVQTSVLCHIHPQGSRRKQKLPHKQFSLYYTACTRSLLPSHCNARMRNQDNLAHYLNICPVHSTGNWIDLMSAPAQLSMPNSTYSHSPNRACTVLQGTDYSRIGHPLECNTPGCN